MKIKVITVGTDASGKAGFTHCFVDCIQPQYDKGNHYEAARERAYDEGFEPKVWFDDRDGPQWLFDAFDWNEKTITIMI